MNTDTGALTAISSASYYRGHSSADIPDPRRMRNPFRYFNSSPEVIRLPVMMCI